nr:MAG TPA: hypothetical protein [Caudoviricetes sp.]
MQSVTPHPESALRRIAFPKNIHTLSPGSLMQSVLIDSRSRADVSG